MGELLLVCALVTLVLLVLYINKKKQEERQFYAELQNRKHRDSNYSRRYSRDDSILQNKKSPLPGESNLKDRYRSNLNYSPIYDKNRNYDYFNTSNQFNKSFLTPTGLNDTYEKYEREKRNMRNLIRSEDVDLQTEKFAHNTSNNKLNPSNSNFNFANEYAKYNNIGPRQSISSNTIPSNNLNSLSKSQSFPAYNPINTFSLLNNANFPTQASTDNFSNNINNNLNNNQPGYKVIKLEDFLSNQNDMSTTSPMFKNQNKISLDDVNPSLIKYLHKNDDNYYNQFQVKNIEDNNKNNLSNVLYQASNVFSQPPLGNVSLAHNNINSIAGNNLKNPQILNNNTSPFKPLSSQQFKEQIQENTDSKLDSDFYNDLIPKKIDFSKIDTISQKKKEESGFKPPERVLNFTPTAKKDESIKFESFGDHQNNIMNPNQDETLKSIKSSL